MSEQPVTTWDQFDEVFYENATREELIAGLKQLSAAFQTQGEGFNALLAEKEAALCRAEKVLKMVYRGEGIVYQKGSLLDEAVQDYISSMAPCSHEAEIVRLKEAIRWALDTTPDTDDLKIPGGEKICWRAELRRRTGEGKEGRDGY